jgi:hypothetical protein
MIQKAQLFARACAGISARMALALLPIQLPAPSIALNDPLLYMARGTGRTTGVVIELLISNPTTAPLRTSVGDCFIPSAEGYQGYVITEVYPVTAPPLSTVAVQLKGYCTNFDRPALAAGAAAAEVSNWIAWSAADPMPERGKPIPAAFVPAAAVQDDPLVLTYPESSIPFAYQLDMEKNPQAAARLLLHTAYAAEKAFDQLFKEGKIRAPSGRTADVFRQELVQQVLWAYASRLEGHAYSKPHFAAQLTEEAEQQMNRPAKDFSPETQQAIERQTQDMWAGIALVGASAKLIAVADHPADVFKTTPAGGETAPPDAVKDIVNNIEPTRQGAGEQLIPVLSYMQKNAGAQDLQNLMATAITKWKAFLNQTATAAAISPTAFLTAVHYLMINPGNALTTAEQEAYLQTLRTKLSTYLQQQAADMQTGSPDYLQRLRNLIGRQNTPWYQKYCLPADPLKILRPMPDKTSQSVAFDPAGIQLSGESWKHAFPPPPAEQKKIPLWAPIVGVAGAGTISYFLLQKKDGDKTPAAPVANPDAVTIPCGGQTDLNLSANDTGEGIYVSSAGSSAGLTITILDAQRVRIVATSTGIFSAVYTITDRVGQFADGTITITVIDQNAPVITCPPAVTLEGCGEIPLPTVSGQATATDDCDLTPPTGFADEVGGTPCDRIITRTWTAVDASGKNAVCSQSITVHDRTNPVFTTCPVPVTVVCGQENNLTITGQPIATDLCSGTVTITFTDDLSQFANCAGTITRSFIATDACGNTALCLQLITVEAPPCNFTPVFTTQPALCGDCNGLASVSLNPPGSYLIAWENGTSGPTAQALCPGTVTLTVTDAINGCTETFSVMIPELSMLTLTVLQVTPPSGPSGNDGKVTLQITPPSAQAPFLVFVNGMPTGLVSTTNFQITNLPAGDFNIRVVDDGGEGCPSNTVVIVLAPQALVPPLEISTSGTSPGIYHDPRVIEKTLSVQVPEHPVTEPLHTLHTWAPAWGIAAGISIAENRQLRLEAARQSGLLFTSAASGLTYLTPVQAGYTRIGFRRYFPQYNKWTFFQEINAARITLRSGNTWSNADQQWIATAQQDAFWQSSLGAGLRRQIAPNITLEMNLQLAFQLRKNTRDTFWSPAINIRLHSALRTHLNKKL